MAADFALIYRDPGPTDRRKVAEVLAEPLGRPVANLLPEVSHRWGILAEGITQFTAQHCALVLKEAGLAAAALPVDQLFVLPERTEMRALEFSPIGLTDPRQKQRRTIPWEHLVFMDVVRFQVAEMKVEVDFHRELSGTFPPRGRQVEEKVNRLNTNFPFHLDLVAKEPWRWLRISMERFFFGSTGLALQANRKQNLYGLALELAKRAPQAVTGTGYKGLDGSSAHEHESLGEDAWRHRLRWRVSLIDRGL